MAKNSKIEWTDHTWNPITGCTPISEGCRNCYARRIAKRFRGRFGYPEDEPFRVTFHPERLEEPLRWKKPRKVFVCSMGDLFHEGGWGDWVLRIWSVMAASPQHIFQVLTKRAERAKDLLAYWMLPAMQATLSWIPGWPLKNVWFGVTAENQKCADERISILLQILAAIRWVSLEPLLGPVDLTRATGSTVFDGGGCDFGMVSDPRPFDWVVIGCETGPNRRPCKLKWVRGIIEQCDKAGVPVFVKQLEINGKVSHNPEDWPEWARRREFPREKLPVCIKGEGGQRHHG